MPYNGGHSWLPQQCYEVRRIVSSSDATEAYVIKWSGHCAGSLPSGIEELQTLCCKGLRLRGACPTILSTQSPPITGGKWYCERPQSVWTTASWGGRSKQWGRCRSRRGWCMLLCIHFYTVCGTSRSARYTKEALPWICCVSWILHRTMSANVIVLQWFEEEEEEETAAAH